jgi:hypothetical protein
MVKNQVWVKNYNKIKPFFHKPGFLLIEMIMTLLLFTLYSLILGYCMVQVYGRYGQLNQLNKDFSLLKNAADAFIYAQKKSDTIHKNILVESITIMPETRGMNGAPIMLKKISLASAQKNLFLYILDTHELSI